MNYSTDSYAAMLLCLSLAPNKEEYARPLTTAEYRDVCRRVRASSAVRLSGLMNVDISGIMQLLMMSESEAYRIYMLMSRSVQLSYSMEAFADRGIRIVSEFDDEYPQRIMKRAGEDAPPVFFMYGDASAFAMPSIGILGMSGVKTVDEARDSINAIVDFAPAAGYSVMTGAELGVSRAAEGRILAGNCALACIAGGGLSEYVARPEIRRLSEEGRFAAISLEHPDAAFDAPRAIFRNKLLIALAEAVFIFNTDGRRGENDALRNRRSDWIYAYENYPGNAQLLSRGALGFTSLDQKTLTDMAELWRASRSEQISIFDEA